MKVKDYMSTPVVTVPSVTPVRDAARQMDFSGVGCLVVVDAGRMVGVITDRDLALRALARDLPGDTTQVRQVMSRAVISVAADDDIDAAVAAFRRNAVRRLPVVVDDAVVGMVTVDDLLLHAHQILSALLGPVSGEILEPQHAMDAAGTGPASAGA